MKHPENAPHYKEEDKKIEFNCVGEYNYSNIFVRPQVVAEKLPRQ